MQETITNRRKTDREYLLKKSILFIGAFDQVPELITVFQRSFKMFESSYHIEYILEQIEKYDVIFCLEDQHTLSYLQSIRSKNEDIPFILMSCDNYPSSNATTYIEDKLSHYIQSGFSQTDIIYIVQHELQRYDAFTKNKLLEIKNNAYLEMLDKFVIVSRTDLSGKITYVNDIFCEVNKFTREELIGKSHNITRHPDTNSTIFKDLWHTIKKDQVWEGTLKNQNKEKETYIAKTIIFPFYYESEKIGYMAIRYVMTEEITQNKDLKAYIMKTVLDLKKQIKEQGTSHEIILREKDKKIKYLELLSEQSISVEEESLQKKIHNQEIQITSYDEKIKTQDALHKKRVAEYLKEKREVDSALEEKDREIKTLNAEVNSHRSQIIELEEVISDQKKTMKHLKKQLDIEKDLLEHREEQLAKLQ